MLLVALVSPPPRQTVLVRDGSSNIFFAAHSRGKWVHVQPGGKLQEIAAPQLWFDPAAADADAAVPLPLVTPRHEPDQLRFDF